MCETKPNVGRLGYLGDGDSMEHIVRNRPNWRSESCQTNPISGNCGFPPLQSHACHAKQSQLPAGAGCTKQTQLGGQIVRNKANSPPGQVTSKSFMGKELWYIAHATDLSKTKPISGGAGWDEAAGTQDTEQTCKTKPIRGASPATGPGDVRRGSCANEAN